LPNSSWYFSARPSFHTTDGMRLFLFSSSMRTVPRWLESPTDLYAAAGRFAAATAALEAAQMPSHTASASCSIHPARGDVQGYSW
jgi:hypothetical protein